VKERPSSSPMSSRPSCGPPSSRIGTSRSHDSGGSIIVQGSQLCSRYSDTGCRGRLEGARECGCSGSGPCPYGLRARQGSRARGSGCIDVRNEKTRLKGRVRSQSKTATVRAAV
jgi:hypothetical protein